MVVNPALDESSAWMVVNPALDESSAWIVINPSLDESSAWMVINPYACKIHNATEVKYNKYKKIRLIYETETQTAYGQLINKFLSFNVLYCF